jgi:pimeloyl-ACP methyl ester carboxylesterase
MGTSRGSVGNGLRREKNQELFGVPDHGQTDAFFPRESSSKMNTQMSCAVMMPNMWLGVDLGHKAVKTTVTLLNRGKSGCPWFFVHDVLGDAQQYATLAFFCKAPLYGLGLAADSPLGSVDELAARHITGIRSVQATGPYVIGGYSLGGLIAMKIVAALEASGETVSKLLLVDVFGNEMHKCKLPSMDNPRTRAGYCGLRSFMPLASKALADQLIYALEVVRV